MVYRPIRSSFLFLFFFSLYIYGQNISNATIIGSVKDSKSQTPLQGVQLILNVGFTQGMSLDTVYTDASGNYQFTNISVRTNDRVSISASLENYQPSFKPRIMLESDASDTVDFLLTEIDSTAGGSNGTATIIGKVTADSLNGFPIANALISLISGVGPAGTVLQTTISDNQGNYFLSNIPSNRQPIYTITVSAENFQPAFQSQLQLDSGQMDTIHFALNSMDSSSWVITGTVFEDSSGGKALSGVLVQYRSNRGIESSYIGTTDVNGSYSILIPNITGTYTITAALNGYLTTSESSTISQDSVQFDIILEIDTNYVNLRRIKEDNKNPFHISFSDLGVILKFQTSFFDSPNYHLTFFNAAGENIMDLEGAITDQTQKIKIPNRRGVMYVRLTTNHQNYWQTIMPAF